MPGRGPAISGCQRGQSEERASKTPGAKSSVIHGNGGASRSRDIRCQGGRGQAIAGHQGGQSEERLSETRKLFEIHGIAGAKRNEAPHSRYAVSEGRDKMEGIRDAREMGQRLPRAVARR